VAQRRERAGAVVFDVGGVLVDWNPRNLYRTIFSDETEMERFLGEVCTPAWHRQHDLGVPFEATAPPLIAAHPDYEREIRAWGARFAEMFRGPIEGSVAVLRALRSGGVPTYAATNYAADAWSAARERWRFLNELDGALVSGEVGLAKPDPAFFVRLAERFGLEPGSTLFVDDSTENVEAARSVGFLVLRFGSPDELEEECRRLGLPL